MKKMSYVGLGSVLALLLSMGSGAVYGSTGVEIDDSLKGQNHRDRKGAEVNFYILHSVGYSDPWVHHHYVNKTGAEGKVNGKPEKSYGVSAHHFVSQESLKIWELAPKERASYHAGVSDWGDWNKNHGSKGLNDYSMGTEFQYLGYAQPAENPNAPKFFPVDGNPYLPFHFPGDFDPVVTKLGVPLAVSVVKEFKIPGEHVLPHSSISYKKSDPGPHFFWDELAKEGVGVLAQTDRVLDVQLDASLVNVQRLLSKWGYPDVPQTGEFDEGTRKALQAHYMHHLPGDIKWGDFAKQTKGTVFGAVQTWADFGPEKAKLVINLMNLIDGEYKYVPLFSINPKVKTRGK